MGGKREYEGDYSEEPGKSEGNQAPLRCLWKDMCCCHQHNSLAPLLQPLEQGGCRRQPGRALCSGVRVPAPQLLLSLCPAATSSTGRAPCHGLHAGGEQTACGALQKSVMSGSPLLSLEAVDASPRLRRGQPGGRKLAPGVRFPSAAAAVPPALAR